MKRVLVTINPGYGEGFGPDVKITTEIAGFSTYSTIDELLVGVEILIPDEAEYIFMQSLGVCMNTVTLPIETTTTSTTSTTSTSTSSTTTTTTTYEDCELTPTLDDVDWYTSVVVATPNATEQSITGDRLTFAQTVNNNRGIVIHVDVNMYRKGSPNYELVGYLYQCYPEDFNGDETLSGLTLLGTSTNTVSAADISTSTDTTVTFNFDEICVGSAYIFVIRAQNVTLMDVNNTIAVMHNSNNEFSDGKKLTYYINYWSPEATDDLVMTINYSSVGDCGTGGC